MAQRRGASSQHPCYGGMDLGDCRHKTSVHQDQEGRKHARNCSLHFKDGDGRSVIHVGLPSAASNLCQVTNSPSVGKARVNMTDRRGEESLSRTSTDKEIKKKKKEDYTYEMLEIPGDAGKKKEKRNSLVLSPGQRSEGTLTPEGIFLVRWKETAL